MSICERFANIGLHLSCTRAAVPNIQFSHSRRPEPFAEGSNTEACNVDTVHLQAVSVYVAHESLRTPTKQKCVFYYGVTGSGGNCFHLRYHSQSGTEQHPKKNVRSSSLRWMITTPCVYVGGWLVDPLVPPALHTHGYPCAPCIPV